MTMQSVAKASILIWCALVLVACGDASAPAPPVPPNLAGDWRMQSFDGLVLPAAYAEFFDEPLGDGIIDHVEIRLDSAVKQMQGDSIYRRRYFFSELHDGTIVFRYFWGDHGKFSLSGTPPAAITLTSEYIQNLTSAGNASANGSIQLTEELWVGEEPRHTVWIKQR
jgi:hypothetical protein